MRPVNPEAGFVNEKSAKKKNYLISPNAETIHLVDETRQPFASLTTKYI